MNTLFFYTLIFTNVLASRNLKHIHTHTHTHAHTNVRLHTHTHTHTHLPITHSTLTNNDMMHTCVHIMIYTCRCAHTQ